MVCNPNGILSYKDTDNISKELLDGLKVFNSKHKLISVFGSARVKPDTLDYSLACDIGDIAAKNGYGIITGGGPGIMEAAAKGCALAGGVTYGINIRLPYEQFMNPYIKIPFFCKQMFNRKILLTCNSIGFVVMPGGFGTLDELFEIVTLVSTTLSKPVPIVLANSSYWAGLYQWIEEKFIPLVFINKNELKIIKILDRPIDIITYISQFNS